MIQLGQFLAALANLVRTGGIKKVADAIRFAKQEFGEVTPLLERQIRQVFDKFKKPQIGKPGKKEGTVLPFIKEQKPLDEVNLSDNPMDDLEEILRGEGDTGKPSQFTDQDVEEAIDNASPGFASGDNKYNAELVAEELAESKGIDYDSLPVKERSKIYGRALDGLQKLKMKKEVTKADELMDFFQKEIDKAEKPSGKFEGLESTDNTKLGIENLKNPRRPGGPLDPATGIARTIARRILDKKGIKIDRREDPIDIFINNFGIEIGTDVQALADDIVDAEQTGRNLKPLDDLIEIEGLFDIEVDPNPNKGITNEEMIKRLEKDLKEKEILENFDPSFRKPNAGGGIMRTNYAMGSDDELPEDPTKPINPFGPKPSGPVLPDKSMMASDDANERLLEQLYERFLDEGFSPEVAAEKARQFFDQMSEAKDRKAPSIKLAAGGLAYLMGL